MVNDGEPGNELQQGQQVVNDVDLSDPQVQSELDSLDIRLEVESVQDSLTEGINDLNKRFDDLNKRLDSLTEGFTKGINDLNKRFDDLNKRLDSLTEGFTEGINNSFTEILNGLNKTTQETDRAKKEELECETNTKTTTTPLSEIFKERIRPHIPPHVLQVIEKELAKLQLLQPSSNEFNVTRNYLDVLIDFPWGIYSGGKNCDIPRAQQILNEEHYGLAALKQTILENLAVGVQSGNCQGKIICLSGPPGVGKTSIACSIARALNRKFFQISVGGLSDVSEIKGHRRTYMGAMPGKMVKGLIHVGTADPVVLIDEIDKLSRGHLGDPASAMLELLDPVQNAKFVDHYVDVSIDLSKVLFVCTANAVDAIPKPLLDRMEVIDIAGYNFDEKISIARDYLEKDIRKMWRIEPEKIEVTDAALLELVQNYCQEAGVRELRILLEMIYRKIILQQLLNQPSVEANAVPTDLPADQPSDSKDLANTEMIQESEATKIIVKVVVDTSNLADFVGRPKHPERFFAQLEIGVAMGLAWTAKGGSILYIEIVPTDEEEGKGDLTITGRLGDVMRESAQIAYVVARSELLKNDPDNPYFANTKLHLHVPRGAIPKDGPSAGCTMITAFLSLAMRKLVKEDLAITGEVTLKGKILPIGKVMEKTIAARRNGVKTIILPLANERDINELAPNLKEGLRFHFVDDYSKIMEVVFRDD